MNLTYITFLGLSSRESLRQLNLVITTLSNVWMICWKYTLHIFSQNALYFVPSLIFNHFLLNILKIIKPLCPNNSHSPLPTMWMKKVHFSILKHTLYHFLFKLTQTHTKILSVFCIANKMKSIQMIYFRNWAKGSWGFLMDKICYVPKRNFIFILLNSLW